jgi:myo-inositol-1(or 4)-monophosphatase
MTHYSSGDCIRSELSSRVFAAKKAVDSQLRFLHEQLGRAEYALKADGSRVTTADVSISTRIFDILQKDFPEDDFCSEESETKQIALEAEFAWVLDPIDGTHNFSLGIPLCAISLALLENGIPVYGCIYDVMGQKILQGGPNMGVFYGEEIVFLPENKFDENSIVLFHKPFSERDFSLLRSILKHKTDVRCLGTAVLSFLRVAMGQAQGHIDFSLKIWDIAAAYPILKALNLSFVFLSDSPFPLKVFNIDHPDLALYTGNAAFCSYIESLVIAQKVPS